MALWLTKFSACSARHWRGPSFPLRRPLLALALSVHGPLLLQLAGLFRWPGGCLLLGLTGFLLLIFSCWRWRLSWLRWLCLALFLLNFWRLSSTRDFAGQPVEPGAVRGTLRLGEVLWESAQSGSFACRASLGPGQNLALVLPLDLRDAAQIRGSWQEVALQDAGNPGSFSERDWLAGLGIFKKARWLRTSAILAWRDPLERGREALLLALRQNAKKLLGEDAAGLALALCLGQKSGLSGDSATSLRILGLSHVIAVSGMHVACLERLWSRIFPRRRQNGLSNFFFFSFLGAWNILAGWPPGLLRASLVAAFRQASRRWHFRNDLWQSLAWAALWEGLRNPFALYRPAALWSYAAVAAIFYLVPEGGQPGNRTPFRSGGQRLLRALSAMLAAQSAILLLRAEELGRLRPLFLLFAFPLTEAFASLFQLFAVFLLLLPLSSRLPAWLSGPPACLLRWLSSSLLDLCGQAAELPPSRFSYLPLSLSSLFFLLLLILLRAHSVRHSLAWRPWLYRCFLLSLGALSVLLLSLSFLHLLPTRPAQEISFLDVGQGDAAIVRSGSACLLVDCGPPGSFADVLFPYMEAENIPFFDLLILSHAHQDHIGAARELLCYGLVHALAVPASFSGGEELLTEARARGVPVMILRPGEQLWGSEPGAFQARVLAASRRPPGSDPRDANADSLILSFSLDASNIWFTGDMTAEKEALACSEATADAPALLLKVPHHGAASVSGQPFLEALQPRLALISVGAGNRYGHPAKAVLQRLRNLGTEIFRTDRDGCLQLTWQDGVWDIRSYRSDRHLRFAWQEPEENATIAAEDRNGKKW